MSDTPQQPDPLVAQTREQAEAQINELKNDRAWFDAWYAGDPAKRAQWGALHEQAFGTEPAAMGEAGVLSIKADGPLEPGPLPGDTPADGTVLEPGMPGYDEANIALFRPAAPHSYQFPPAIGQERTDAEIAVEIEICNTLHQNAVPPVDAQQIYGVMTHNLRNGPLSDGALETMRAEAIERLTERHGDNAQALIKDASKALSRMLRGQAHRFYDLVDAGVTNNADVIEMLARRERDYYSKLKP